MRITSSAKWNILWLMDLSAPKKVGFISIHQWKHLGVQGFVDVLLYYIFRVGCTCIWNNKNEEEEKKKENNNNSIINSNIIKNNNNNNNNNKQNWCDDDDDDDYYYY